MRAVLALVHALVLGAMALAAPPAHAALFPSGDPAPAETTPVSEQTIETTTDTGTDERIARRIRATFGELPAFADVRVSVKAGVVTLRGSVRQQEDIARAEGIASRIAGVVTVENGLERDVSLDSNLSDLGGVRGKVDGLVAMMPLAGLALVVALVIGGLGYVLASLGGLWHRIAPNGFLAEILASAIRFAFVIGGVVVALDMIGAGALLGAVLGGAGVIGIALGFAMRDTIENFVASVMLSLRQPFRANDWVVIDDQYEGRVIRLTSRATILMTLDGNHLRIPNGTVFNAVILNYTRNPKRRFDFDLGIDADDDPTAARRLGVSVLASLDYVLDAPAPTARIVEVGDSNIVIRFLAWVDQDETDWHKARTRAIPAVKEALENAGFALPEPIYRLRFDSGAPLSLQQGSEPPQGTAPKARAIEPSLPADEREHTAPEETIAQMVEDERREDTGERDLLDSRRPVE